MNYPRHALVRLLMFLTSGLITTLCSTEPKHLRFVRKLNVKAYVLASFVPEGMCFLVSDLYVPLMVLGLLSVFPCCLMKTLGIHLFALVWKPGQSLLRYHHQTTMVLMIRSCSWRAGLDYVFLLHLVRLPHLPVRPPVR